MQVDTFEAVKTNVYSVLGDLARDLHGPELDLLFSKFEACTGWPAPDTLKAMDLLKQLAKSDAKVRYCLLLLAVMQGFCYHESLHWYFSPHCQIVLASQSAS